MGPFDGPTVEDLPFAGVPVFGELVPVADDSDFGEFTCFLFYEVKFLFLLYGHDLVILIGFIIEVNFLGVH